jgi:hypothetical protein
MRSPIFLTSVRMPRWTEPLPRLAVGGAWLFIVFSLAHLAWVVAAKWSDPSGVTALYQTTVGEETFRAWGLAYAGTFGLLLAFAEAAGVAAAVAMSLRARPKTRRIGHLMLIGWSALWALNLIRLASLDLQLDTTSQAMVMTLFFGCTVCRAALSGAPRARGAALEARVQSGDERVAAQESSLTARHVTSTGQVTDITQTAREKHRSPAAFASKLGTMTARLGRAAKPVARSAGRSLIAGGRRLRHYLREKGVIPRSARSTEA